MRQVTGSMMNVVKGMDQAMKARDLEKVYTRPESPHSFPSSSKTKHQIFMRIKAQERRMILTISV